MKSEYKKFVINHMYNGIYGSLPAIENHMREHFQRIFNKEPDNVSVRFSKESEEIFFTGAVEITFSVDGETFVLERDYGEEYNIDKEHSDYETDDWFYESDKSFAIKKRNELLQSIEEE